jgi:predicted Zn-dependent protease
VEVRVSPAALLYFIADTEWELSRLPVSFTRLSDQEEIDAGNRLARSYSLDDLRNLPPEQKQQAQIVADYVTRVGLRVAARAHRKLPYKFHYIPDTNLVNAFALPGGHVFIGAGLIELMDTEDELVAVLGHEIEHIDHYHCAERVQLEARLRRVPRGELLAIPAMVFEAGYSKDQELEADREGTRLAVWASYSPMGAIRMFEAFDRLYQEYVRHAKSPQVSAGGIFPPGD